MVKQQITTSQEALAHLFFHFCKKDGVFDGRETSFIAGKFVQLGLRDSLDFKKQAAAYQASRSFITDDGEYMGGLISTIHPVNTLALYSWCTEIALSDGLLSPGESQLLGQLADLLQIEPAAAAIIKKLMIERSVADTAKLF